MSCTGCWKLLPRKRRFARCSHNGRIASGAKFAEIATSPYDTHNNVTKLQGRDGYRLRVGDWRVLYELHDGELVLLMVDVLPRGSAYRA